MDISYQAYILGVSCIGLWSTLEAITAKTPNKRDVWVFIALLSWGSLFAVHWAIATAPEVLSHLHHLDAS